MQKIHYIIILILIGGCKKSTIDSPWNLPKISTDSIKNITQSSAEIFGCLRNDGGIPIITSGFCWSLHDKPTIEDNMVAVVNDSGVFSQNIANLSLNQKYYVRSFATNNIGTSYGEVFSFTTHLHAIGETFQGGIIAYFLQQGDPSFDSNLEHGLIIASNDLSTSITWDNGSNMQTNATSTLIGDGLVNTNKIYNLFGSSNYAASIAKEFNGSGYNNWCLPSIDELRQIIKNCNASWGFYNNSTYWSSSEYDGSYAKAIQLGGGGYNVVIYKKSALGRVRAIRFF